MNVITYGDEMMGYCETVAGGAGAVSRTVQSTGLELHKKQGVIMVGKSHSLLIIRDKYNADDFTLSWLLWK